MRQIGICQKCGKTKKVQAHHWHGYSEEHKDDVVLYCCKCDREAHIKAKKEGKCNLPKEEIKRRTQNSCHRRTKRTKRISSITLMSNVTLSEIISYNINTGHPCCSTRFQPTKGKKLLYIDI